MVLTGLIPIEPQNFLEKAREISYTIAKYIVRWCAGDRTDVTFSLADGKEIANTLRDLAEAYEGMVEAMNREHDCAVKYLQECNELRDTLRTVNRKAMEVERA